MDGSPSSVSSHKVAQNTIGAPKGVRVDAQCYTSAQSETDPELAGLDALEDGRPGEKPAYPFTTLIRYAIKGSPNGRLLLEDIYNAIQTRYPYFATAPSGWKNSVRHTLSLMTCFEKVPRLLTEPGKGSYWTVNDSMPHAKPSRVRIRKRKTRTDDDDVLFGTPRSVSDVLHPGAPGRESLTSSDQRQRLFPYDDPGDWTRRPSSYVQGDTPEQFSRDNYSVETSRPHSNNGDPCAEDHRHVGEREQPASELELSHNCSSGDPQPTDSVQNKEHEGGLPAPETASSRPIDYRSILMSELDKLRDAIGRRDDIDNEWCRVMIDRVRGTGLLEQV
ncbi:hypothetical protein OPQ81_001945 [Rhizoctonia solani]|nr:hypothetical protein OPQ81_001945 [Rhizoctonia solani]